MANIEERIDDLQAASMLSLRMTADLFSILIERGLFTKDEVIGLWRFSAMQVGEGSPHLELAAKSIVEAMISKFPNQT